MAGVSVEELLAHPKVGKDVQKAHDELKAWKEAHPGITFGGEHPRQASKEELALEADKVARRQQTGGLLSEDEVAAENEKAQHLAQAARK